MPVKRCQRDGKPGYKWGDEGKCYTYTPGDDSSREQAKNKALEQGQAIKAQDGESKNMGKCKQVQLTDSTNLPPDQLEIDREAGLVKNMPLNGLRNESQNRRYSEAAFKDAVGKFTGAPYYVDEGVHEQFDENPSPRNMIGMVDNAYYDADSQVMRGDVKIRDDQQEWFFSLVEDMPQAAGNSSVMLGLQDNSVKEEQFIVEIVDVRRVDLVSRPGTLQGLHDSSDDSNLEEGEEPMLEDLTAEKLHDSRPDLVEEILSQEKGEEAVEELRDSNQELRSQVDELETEIRERDRKETIADMISDSELPERVVTDLFREQLMDAEDEEAMQALIDERMELVGELDQPESRERDIFDGEKNSGDEDLSTEDLSDAVSIRS